MLRHLSIEFTSPIPAGVGLDLDRWSSLCLATLMFEVKIDSKMVKDHSREVLVQCRQTFVLFKNSLFFLRVCFQLPTLQEDKNPSKSSTWILWTGGAHLYDAIR